MEIQRSHKMLQPNRYRKKLIEIARMNRYAPVASIPVMRYGFNFAVSQDGYLKKYANNPCNYSTHESPPRKGNHSKRVFLPRIESRQKGSSVLAQSTEIKSNLKTLETERDNEYFVRYGNIRSYSPFYFEQYPESKLQVSRSKRIMTYFSHLSQMSNLYEQNPYYTYDESEYERDATPGPGSYCITQYSYNDKSKRNKVNSFCFGSKAERFVHSKQQNGSQSYNRTEHQSVSGSKTYAKDLSKIDYEHKHSFLRRKKRAPFLSFCERKSEAFYKKYSSPGPQDYLLRQGMEEELIRRIQRNFKGSFGTSNDRFKSYSDHYDIGPGDYNIENNPSTQVSEFYSYFFLSKKKRFQ